MVFYMNYINIDEMLSDDDFIDLLDMLMLVCYKEGKHILSISPKTVSRILEREGINSSTLVLLKKYQANFSVNSKAIYESFDYIVEIIPSSIKEENIIVGSKEIAKLNIKSLLDSSYFQTSVLLCENQNDTNVFKIILDFYRRNNSFYSFPIRINQRGGGGSTVVQEFENIFKADENFCFCVVDSDKKHDGDSLGETSKKVLKFYTENETNNLKCKLLVLDIHETENLIPLSFYRDILENEFETKRGSTHQIDKLLFYHNEIWKYIDFKNGLNELSTYEKESFREFWGRVLCSISVKCIQFNGVYKYFEGFDNVVLGRFISEFDGEKKVDSYIKGTHLEPEWNSLGNKLSSFYLGTQRISAV